MTLHTTSTVAIPTPSGVDLDAWLLLPDGPGPHPAVVMAHGIGGVKAAGLEPFARAFRDAGFAAVVFDYRHWGRSGGEPRELLSVAAQRADYRAALAWARRRTELDAGALFAWGTSFAGMNVLDVARTERLAGAIAQVPLVDGLAGVTDVPLRRSLRLTVAAVRDIAGSLFRRAPGYLPISVRPGELGLIATSDALDGLHRLMPEDGHWPNRITARSLFSIMSHRPVRHAPKIACPLLMVVAEKDTMAPTRPATAAAARAPRGELYRSRGGHYDVYAGGLDHEAVLRVEVEFLRRHR